MAFTSATPSKRYTIPVFVAFSLCGFYFIVYQMYASQAPDRFLAAHKASNVPVTPTGNMLPFLDEVLGRFPHMDKILTPLISFFVAAFGNTNSTAYPTVAHFVWSFGCAIQLPIIEAHRNGVKGSKYWSTWFLSFPMIWGILYQRLSGGWIIPLWLIAFMGANTRAESSGIGKANAESVLAGWWAGHTIPALCMLIPNQPILDRTPIWVAFPILMTLCQRSTLRFLQWFFTPARNCKSGDSAIKLLYLSSFLAAFAAHLHLILIPFLSSAAFSAPTQDCMLNKFLGLALGLRTFFEPKDGIECPAPFATTAPSGVVHFVQYDVIIVFGAVWTALIWDFIVCERYTRIDVMDTGVGEGNPRKAGKAAAMVAGMIVIMALCVGAVILSPGAATSGFLYVRECDISNIKREKRKRSTLPSPLTPSIIDEKLLNDA